MAYNSLQLLFCISCHKAKHPNEFDKFLIEMTDEVQPLRICKLCNGLYQQPQQQPAYNPYIYNQPNNPIQQQEEQKFANKVPFNSVWKRTDDSDYYSDNQLDTYTAQRIDGLNIGEKWTIKYENKKVKYQYKKLTETTVLKIDFGKNMLYRDTTKYKLHIFESTRPRNNFKESNFLKIYDTFGKKHMDKITPYVIKLCLPSVIIKRQLAKKLQQLEEQKSTDITKNICVWLWSLEADQDTENLYQILNEALYSDNYDDIEKYMPLIRGLNQFLVQPIKVPMTTYRGSKMSKLHFRYIQSLEGRFVRCPAIVASSQSKTKARTFKSKVMIEFEIPQGIWNAAPIAQHSAYDEQEVLFPPYSSFKVKGTRKKGQETWILLKAYDNRGVRHDVPSIFV